MQARSCHAWHTRNPALGKGASFVCKRPTVSFTGIDTRKSSSSLRPPFTPHTSKSSQLLPILPSGEMVAAAALHGLGSSMVAEAVGLTVGLVLSAVPEPGSAEAESRLHACVCVCVRAAC